MTERDLAKPRASSAATPAAVTKAKPRKWYSLYDKVYAPKNLEQAWKRVQSNKGAAGCDGQTVEQFARNVEENLARLHEQLRAKTYRPQRVKRVEIPKSGGGKRALGIPTVRDRIVQQAALQIMQNFALGSSCAPHWAHFGASSVRCVGSAVSSGASIAFY